MGDVAHLEGRTEDTRLKKALVLVREKFNQPLSMDSLAKAAGLSTRSLNRIFLDEIGLTPKQAVTLYRIEQAKVL